MSDAAGCGEGGARVSKTFNITATGYSLYMF